MRRPIAVLVALSGFGFLLVGSRGRAEEPDRKPDTSPTHKQVVERGLTFLVKDAARWRKELQCATCHHGTMTVWALTEARAQGYTVDGEAYADIVKWTKERLKDIDKPRDTRPGWNMVSTPAVYLALMALVVPRQDALSADERKQILGHLLRHQESDGSWAWSLAPAKNRAPPVFESDEVVTLMALLTLNLPPARDGREKAAAWLEKSKPGTGMQAALLRVFRDVQAGKSPKDVQKGVDDILGRQNKDGGWGQEPGLPSDAFATGQALYYLSLSGVTNDRMEVRRAVSFLLASQKEDGSWPMTSRAHPGEKPATNPVPITYFGSAWATLGLLRCVPK